MQKQKMHSCITTRSKITKTSPPRVYVYLSRATPPDPRPTSHIDNSHPHSDEAKAKQCTKIRGGLGPEARCPKLYVQATSEMKICEARVLRCLCDKAFVKTRQFFKLNSRWPETRVCCPKTLCSGHLKNEGLRSESRGCTLFLLLLECGLLFT